MGLDFSEGLVMLRELKARPCCDESATCRPAMIDAIKRGLTAGLVFSLGKVLSMEHVLRYEVKQ